MNILIPQMQNSGIMEVDNVKKVRRYMQDKIYEFLVKRQPTNDPKRVLEVVRRVDDILFKKATSIDEYMNLESLEGRIMVLLNHRNSYNNYQQFVQLLNASSAMSTMIPTPGMLHSGNPSLICTPSSDTSLLGCNSMEPPSNVSTGNLMSTGTLHPSLNIHGGHFRSQDGTHTTGYHIPSNFPINSGNKMLQSLGASRIHSQMIPTPGYNNNNSISNNSINGQSYMNMDASNNGVGFSAMGPMIYSQLQQQKLHIGAQNSHMFHNINSQMGSGVRSELKQTSHELPNGTVNGRLGSNLPIYRGSGASDGYIPTAECNNSNKSFNQQIGQNPQSVLHGDGFGVSSDNPSGPGNIFAPSTSVGLMMNVQNLSSGNSHSTSQTSSQLMASQLNLQKSQQEVNQFHSVEMSDKMNYVASKENFVNQYRQFQQQSQQFQLPKQFMDHSLNQNSKHSSNNLGFGRSQITMDVGNRSKHTEVSDCHQVFQPCDAEQFQPPGCQFQHNSSEIHDRGIQMVSVSSSRLDTCSSFPQSSQSMKQLLHSHQLIPESQNILLNMSTGTPSGLVIPGTLDCRSQEDQHVQEEFNLRVSGRDEDQQNNLASAESLICPPVLSRGVVESPVSTRTTCRSVTLMSKLDQDFRNQQKWLLFLHHCRRCSAPEGKCEEPHCSFVQSLLKHIDTCQSHHCMHPRCRGTKKLIEHFKFCEDEGCPVCVKVRSTLMKNRERVGSNSVFPSSISGPSKSYNTGETQLMINSNRGSSVAEIPADIPPLKRIKSDQNCPPLISEDDVSTSSHTVATESHSLSSLMFQDYTESHISNSLNYRDYEHHDLYGTVKSESTSFKVELPIISEPVIPYNGETKNNFDNMYSQRNDDNPSNFYKSSGILKQECTNVGKDPNRENANFKSEHPCSTKSGKPKIKGVSLTELFTPEQIKDHIQSLRQWVGQSKAKAEKNQQMENSMSENSCQLCAVEKLTFEPPPIYCSPCGSRIKRNSMFYTVGAGDTRHYFCIPCYNESRGDSIVVDGTSIMKSQIEKKKNDEETEEWWVQCDKCEAWQHQICALFNGRRNDGGQAEYTCPNCYIDELENGERIPLPQSAVLGAKDLPKTLLSDHMEERLFRRLKQERQERAKHLGKSFDEVPGAESLVVRVVSSVDKRLDVKQKFLEIFQEENYPTEYSYKSKVVLLFQKIEGVEVCLFGMYVQEFGSECEFPNQRRVYLSYLDSVKYFRPEIKAVTGEALRTFVYHEILIGYLEYCKRRGFTSCYIWACPPLKGEDYILYCHPEIQKTPKSDKLREWYLSMLRKAAKENIVVDLTNLYDHFFVSSGECKAKVTAARLPYFDGDYWPGAAEEMIENIRLEEDGRKFNRKGTVKKTVTKRALKASGQLDLSGNASRDFRLMHKLGDTISPMKEDFIMVHLQHSCSHCSNLVVIGGLWVCSQCKNFKICDRCYDAEQMREERERHPINQREKHMLYCVEITDVPYDTKDEDDILESEFFDTRQAFLSLCQGNHYQYDTLRRAKHSSMMVLYHLHNPTAPAFVTTCNICCLDIESGQGWRCETCPDYDLCTSCYTRDGGVDHPHNLTNHPSVIENDEQNKEARQLRILQLRRMLDLLIHSALCRSLQCQYPNCRKVKGLFRHGNLCKQRVSGGCFLCKKMWCLLSIHSRACKETKCPVPRCKDLKENTRRLQQQADSRRRAAVMEMMRQRTAEVAGNSG